MDRRYCATLNVNHFVEADNGLPVGFIELFLPEEIPPVLDLHGTARTGGLLEKLIGRMLGRNALIIEKALLSHSYLPVKLII